jgi:hypothetical protein
MKFTDYLALSMGALLIAAITVMISLYGFRPRQVPGEKRIWVNYHRPNNSDTLIQFDLPQNAYVYLGQEWIQSADSGHWHGPVVKIDTLQNPTR